MSRPRTGAHRPNQHERAQRRATIEHLLARALRGALTIPEAAVLADYWRAEQRAADATRKSLTDTTRALTKHREAADAAIRELEQRAEQAEQARAEAEQRNADNWSRAEAAEKRAQVISADRDRLAAELDAAEQRIEQHRRALAAALAVHATAPWAQLIEHARAYVRHTDEWHALAVRRRERAERAEDERDRYRAAWQSARQRARGYARQLNPDAPIPYQVAGPDAPEVITDRAAIRAALDDPEPRPAPQHIGQGANAEDCPACDGTNPPYPFICPGPARQ